MLKPQAMRHVRLLVLREDLPKASLRLAETENFHPDPRGPEERELHPLQDCRYQKEFQQARVRLDKIRQLIPVPEPELDDIRVVELDALASTNEWLGEAWNQCLEQQERFRALDEQQRLLEEEQAALTNFAELHVDLGMLREKTRFLDIHVGIVPRANVSRLEGALGLAGYVLFRYMDKGDQVHVVIVGEAGDESQRPLGLLGTAGFQAIPLPTELDASPETIRAGHRERREQIRTAREALQREVDECAVVFEDYLIQAEKLLRLAEPFVTLDPAISSVGDLA